MKTYKQNPDFLYLGGKLLAWYEINGRDLPFRKTRNPYFIWICEIIFQQTRISQGLDHYHRFVQRFPDVKSLADSDQDEVLLYWKGLGYYSRAINLHKAARQIVDEFNGVFPMDHRDILKLKGVGKYTAAAVVSICYGEKIPAVDGNFYRVLSRVFADDFDTASPKAFSYFSELALRMMPDENPGSFNEAVMDLGSEVCKPRNPECGICPLQQDCLAFALGKTADFPVKSRKVKVSALELNYYFVHHQKEFLIRRRGDDFIWKNLYDFPDAVPPEWLHADTPVTTIKHKLTHRNLTIYIHDIELDDVIDFQNFATMEGFSTATLESSHRKSFPKPLENYLQQVFI